MNLQEMIIDIIHASKSFKDFLKHIDHIPQPNIVLNIINTSFAKETKSDTDLLVKGIELITYKYGIIQIASI